VDLLALPVVAVGWANLHAGWVLLFLIGGAVLVGEAVDRLLHRRPADQEPLGWAELRDLALALAVAAAALIVNPNGAALYGYPFYTVGITALNRYVMEWFPASLGTLFGQLLLGFVLVAVLPTLILGWRRLRTADGLVLVGLTVMAYQAIRFLLIVGPIGGAIAAAVLAPVIWQSRLGQRMAPLIAHLSRPAVGRLRTVNAAVIGLLVVLGCGVTLARVVPATQSSEIARVLPAGAVVWMDQHEPGTRIFNRYEWGGYIGQHRPWQLVFMDGRADVYGDALLKQYVSIIGVEDPQAVFDRYRIDYAVFSPDTPLAGWFDASPQWERVYADATADVWVRR
jgi:hypothetical protein